MAVLSKAPLIETIFEIRWGKVEGGLPQKPGQPVTFKFSSEDVGPFYASFEASASKNGFECIEIANPHIGDNPIPHVVTKRYRKEPNTWPCYQIGIGVMTVNQINDGYSWQAFRDVCIEGVKLLDASLPNGLSGVHGIGVELKYQDGFVFKAGETAASFLEKNFEFDFKVPNKILQSPSISDEVINHAFSIATRTLEPKGSLNLNLNEGMINGKKGFVLESAVRSADHDCPSFDMRAIDTWLSSAHAIQKHAFETIINPVYAGGFK